MLATESWHVKIFQSLNGSIVWPGNFFLKNDFCFQSQSLGTPVEQGCSRASFLSFWRYGRQCLHPVITCFLDLLKDIKEKFDQMNSTVLHYPRTQLIWPWRFKDALQPLIFFLSVSGFNPSLLICSSQLLVGIHILSQKGLWVVPHCLLLAAQKCLSKMLFFSPVPLVSSPASLKPSFLVLVLK